MLRPLRSLCCLSALCLGLSACSFLVGFDEEGQPCDDRNQCLPGYACVDDACVSSGAPTSDAGVDAGTSGGGDAGADAGP